MNEHYTTVISRDLTSVANNSFKNQSFKIPVDESINKIPRSDLKLEIKKWGYSTTREELYTEDHPKVLSWTHFFRDRASEIAFLETPRSDDLDSLKRRSLVVACQWYHFSSFMPWFLCQASALVSSNEKRHYILQTAFEELGMRDVDEIHCELFWNAVESAGISTLEREKIGILPEINDSLNHLRRELSSEASDSFILGILLGLEIPATENIECIFNSIGYDAQRRRLLSTSKFFIIHKHVETEHVRLTVANFLRFCVSSDERAAFMRGFDSGVFFWKTFWSGIQKQITKETNYQTDAYV